MLLRPSEIPRVYANYRRCPLLVVLPLLFLALPEIFLRVEAFLTSDTVKPQGRPWPSVTIEEAHRRVAGLRVMVLPPPESRNRFRFRNLTRAIEYSVVHHNNEDEDVLIDSIDTNETTCHQNFSSNNNNNKRKKIIERKNNNDLSPEMSDPGFDHENNNEIGVRQEARRSTRSARVRLVFANKGILLRYLLAVGYRWLVRTVASLQRRFLRQATERSRATATPRGVSAARGFSEDDLGGRKRHYALLVASVLSGYGIGNRNADRLLAGTAALVPTLDPLAHHRTIVSSAHQRRVASLSPSSLSRNGRWSSSSSLYYPATFLGEGGCSISVLQLHARRWWMGNQRKRRKEEERDATH